MTIKTDAGTPAPETTIDPMAALDAGIAGEPMPEPATPPVEPADLVAPTPDQTPDPLDAALADEAPAEPAPTDPPAAKADEPAPTADDAPTPDAEVEAEISALGMKGKTADRFRDLSGKVAAAEPLRAALETVGVTTPDQVAQLAQDASRGFEIADAVRATGASPDEFAGALKILDLRHEFRTTHNREAAQQAFDLLAEELVNIGTVLGIDPGEIASRFDPLAGHEDLRDLVEAGDMPRKLAVETAQGRNLRAHADTQRQAQQQTQAQTDAQAAAHQDAKRALNELGTLLAGEDRARISHYLADGTMGRLVAETKAAFPDRPDLWADKVEVAYRRLPAPPAATPAPTPAPSPARSAAPLPPEVAPNWKDISPEAALDMALGLG